jgi:hypothetical protein
MTHALKLFTRDTFPEQTTSPRHELLGQKSWSAALIMEKRQHGFVIIQRGSTEEGSTDQPFSFG